MADLMFLKERALDKARRRVLGVASRKGSLRTIAAVHNQINQAVATPLSLHIECRKGSFCDSRKINLLPVLGVRDDPSLEAIPSRQIGEGIDKVGGWRSTMLA